MSTPSITRAQVVATVKVAGALAAAFGLNLTGAQQAELISAATGLGAAIVLADAIIRKGRVSLQMQREWTFYESAREAAHAPSLTTFPAVSNAGSGSTVTVVTPPPSA